MRNILEHISYPMLQMNLHIKCKSLFLLVPSEQKPNIDLYLKLAGDVRCIILKYGVRSREFHGSWCCALPLLYRMQMVAHSTMWIPDSERMGGWGATWAAGATGVETVRQALVCLHGALDTISDWCQHSQLYLLGEGGWLCLHARYCFYKCWFRGR